MAPAVSALTLVAAVTLSVAAGAPAPPALRGAPNASAPALQSSGAQCSWESGRNSHGSNIKQAPWSADPQTCCNHCGETRNCVAWTFVEGSHECWLKGWVPAKSEWDGEDGLVSGTVNTQPSGSCTQLSGTYCGGQGQQCNCDYCDDFCDNSACARTCRVLNGHFSSPAQSTCQWSATSVQNPNPAADGTSCSWMAGNGQNGHGDDCKQCDENAMKCRRTNSNGNCRAF